MDSKTFCQKQEDTETMSNYAESCDTYLLDYDPVDPEEVQNEPLFEKPRGERRWLGREHHRGKERLHKSVKDRTFIEKTVTATEPLSKNATKKIEASTRDGLEFNVIYSLDKKHRWETTDTVSLLGATPENVNAEVVEKNGLETAGLVNPQKSTFAVHSRIVDPKKEPGDFDIRSAKSTGKGQHYSNFLPATREFSKKANARTMTIRGEEPLEKVQVSEPTISYNIYKAHPSQDLVGGQLFKSRLVSKSGKHRANKKVDMDTFDEDDYFDEEEDDFEFPSSSKQFDNVWDLSSLAVGNRTDKQFKKHHRKDSEISFEIIEPRDFEAEQTSLLNIKDCLHNEGYMFEEADVTFHNQKDNIEHQMNRLSEEPKLIIKSLRPKQYLIDVSGWCQLDDVKDGETTTVVVISHIKHNMYHVLVNSTIPGHPSKRGSDYLRRQISSAITMREAITRITTEILSHRKILEAMKKSSEFYGRKTFVELFHDHSEWENQHVNMEWPNQHYHATWANSEELSQVGGKLEWSDLCAMVRKESQCKTEHTFEDVCGLCSLKKNPHELFLVDNETKCTDCLRTEFYREFRGKRLPIDLQTKTHDELEYLPTFIPLTILNIYIRMVSETIYKDLGATGDFEKCPSCKSALFFEELPSGSEKNTQNRSCPCGYSWCRRCERVPHWPMKCGEYTEWEQKWLLRYAMTRAQGSGTETLLQVTCSCAKQTYNVMLPKEFIECPGCKININSESMQSFWKRDYEPYPARFRKLVEAGYYYSEPSYNSHIPPPRDIMYIDLTKVPAIRASVMEICKSARDVRYDLVTRNRAVNREHILIRKGVMEKEVVENLLGTSAYLVETVTAWMYVTNHSDRQITNLLEKVMLKREDLLELLDGEDLETINGCIKKLRKTVNDVVSAVERIIETSESSS